MKKNVSRLAVLTLILSIIAVIPAVVSAAARDTRTGLWQLQLSGSDRQSVSVLSITKDKTGALSGKWLSPYGASDLKDLRFEDNKLTFTRISTRGDQQTTSTFTGTVDNVKLSGTVSSSRGDMTVTGSRVRFVPRPAGLWEVSSPAAAKLTISAAKKGKLQATWQGDSAQDIITNVAFKDNALTFNRKTTGNGKSSESSFTGTVKGNKLTGTLKTPDGEIPLEAVRFGGALIGRWNLDIASDSETRSQMLIVRPDLSGLYGAIPVEKINLDGNQVSFKAAIQIGDRNYETTFTGTVESGKLTGQLTSSRGARQVTGSRINPVVSKKAPKAKQAFRKPDVIFVPTPQKVVDRMLQLAQVKKDDLIYDLGCGDGRIVVTAAKEYGSTGIGYDISARRVKESLANVEKENVADLVTIQRKDIFTLDLSKPDVITLYLLPELNVKLIPQLEKCRPGTRIVSHDFDMRGVKPDQTITIEDNEDEYGDHTLYLWTTPLKKE